MFNTVRQVQDHQIVTSSSSNHKELNEMISNLETIGYETFGQKFKNEDGIHQVMIQKKKQPAEKILYDLNEAKEMFIKR